MIKVLLVDDEFPARGELGFLLQEFGLFDIVGECEDGDEAVEYIKNNTVDVVFLDIHMSIKDGLTAAWEIIHLDHHPYIVFTTGYNEYAVKAFELNAVDYVMKPYSKRRIEQTVKKLKNIVISQEVKQEALFKFLSQRTDLHGRLSVWFNDKLIVLTHDQIVFIKADKKGQSILYTVKGIYHTGFALKEVEEKLNSHQFYRTHKSFLVNLSKIKEIVPWFNNTYIISLEYYPNEQVPVSRHFMKEFNEKMGI